jgi:hypothetical protein
MVREERSEMMRREGVEVARSLWDVVAGGEGELTLGVEDGRFQLFVEVYVVVEFRPLRDLIFCNKVSEPRVRFRLIVIEVCVLKKSVWRLAV